MAWATTKNGHRMRGVDICGPRRPGGPKMSTVRCCCGARSEWWRGPPFVSFKRWSVPPAKVRWNKFPTPVARWNRFPAS